MSRQRLLRELDRDLAAAGLRASYLARDLDSGEEVGIDPDVRLPLASLVKVPLAIAVLEHARRGLLDESTTVRVLPGAAQVAGPAGLSRFRHPASVAVGDLLHLSVAISDNAATDALFALVGPEEVTAVLVGLGIEGIVVRHPIAELSSTPVESLPDDRDLALALAAAGTTAAGGHRVRQLDVSQASVGTARILADLLALVWEATGSRGVLDPGVAARVRELMGDNVHRQRLWPDLASDAARWSSKTGTVLHLRHEMGVVEHDDGARHAIVALTSSSVPASTQPQAEATMGRVARRLHDHLREG